MDPSAILLISGLPGVGKSHFVDWLGRRGWGCLHSDDDPDDRNARHNLALLSARRRDFSKADRLWRANISSDPNFLPSRVAYAESLASRALSGESRHRI